MIRNTRQRKAIFDVLKEEARPLSVVEIFELAVKSVPGIGIRTVYRNIRELVEEGKLVGVDYPGQPPRYETVGDKSHRPHLICGICHKVLELDASVVALVQNVEIPGYVVEGAETVYYGHCADPERCPRRSRNAAAANQD